MGGVGVNDYFFYGCQDLGTCNLYCCKLMTTDVAGPGDFGDRVKCAGGEMSSDGEWGCPWAVP